MNKNSVVPTKRFHVLSISVVVLVFGRGAAFAAVLHVPADYPSILAAYTNSAPDDTIEVDPGLYLEITNMLFNGGKHVFLRPTGGRAIIAANTPPANDDFSGATVLVGRSLTTASFNFTATINPGDPLPGFAGGNPARFGRSLWWIWTAPADGLVVVNTVGSEIPTLLEVFRGTNYPPAALSEETGLVWLLPNETGFRAVAGQTYPILAGGENSAYGQIVLNLNYTLPPTNDPFTNALELTGNDLQIAGATLAATPETPAEPNHAGVAAGNSVWFKWIAPTNDAISPRDCNLTTAGSDFDTALAVYTGTNLVNLTHVTSNDDRALGEHESRITFTPVPGTSYYIALDGSSNPASIRQRLGNYLLHLDYSLVNVRTNSHLDTTTNSDLKVSFSVGIRVFNSGFASTGPLRVRLVARPGRNLAGIHLAPTFTETNLGSPFAVLPVEGLQPGRGNLQPFVTSGVCPAPFVRDGQTNVWGVFALLEEQLSGAWLTIDRAFLLYGYVPEGGGPILSYGIGRPVPPAIGQSEINKVLARGIRLSNYATDWSTNQLMMIALLDPSGERTITNATWSGSHGSNFTLTTNGLLSVAQLQESTSLTVTGRFNLGGVSYTNSDTVPIYMRPHLIADPISGSNVIRLSLLGDVGRRYALESTPSLPAMNWSTDLSLTPTNREAVLTNLSPTLGQQRFYRVKLLP